MISSQGFSGRPVRDRDRSSNHHGERKKGRQESLNLSTEPGRRKDKQDPENIGIVQPQVGDGLEIDKQQKGGMRKGKWSTRQKHG